MFWYKSCLENKARGILQDVNLRISWGISEILSPDNAMWVVSLFPHLHAGPERDSLCWGLVERFNLGSELASDPDSVHTLQRQITLWKSGTSTSTVAAFTIFRTCKQSRYPSKDERIMKMQCQHIIALSSAVTNQNTRILKKICNIDGGT